MPCRKTVRGIPKRRRVRIATVSLCGPRPGRFRGTEKSAHEPASAHNFNTLRTKLDILLLATVFIVTVMHAGADLLA
jgi:hypothetical protein